MFPEYELGFQVMTEAQAERFSFDVLDPTKIVPEELVPVQPVGRMVLNRNPDNFFAETEQVAFGVQNVVPGIDFSNDPLLAGRIHSYFDTQLLRLGGPNFHEIPINTPINQAHNNQRDGFHRQAIHRGRVAYEPNSLGGGSPYQAGPDGFVSFPEPIAESKVRGKPEKFADHFSQATLFWNSQTAAEKAHIIRGFRFESPKFKSRQSGYELCDAAQRFRRTRRSGSWRPRPCLAPRNAKSIEPPPAEVMVSPALSLTARPGNGDIRGRRVAILVGPGVDADSVQRCESALTGAGGVVRRVAADLNAGGDVEWRSARTRCHLRDHASVLFDAVVVPDGADELGALGQSLEFLRDQYRHCKPILFLGSGGGVVADAGIPTDDEFDWALCQDVGAFIKAVGKHRTGKGRPTLPSYDLRPERRRSRRAAHGGTP